MQWRSLFESIREATDLQAAPREQGRSAARMLREATSFGHGAKGNGEILRGVLRSLGVLVFETPIKDSHVEGLQLLCGHAVRSATMRFFATLTTSIGSG